MSAEVASGTPSEEKNLPPLSELVRRSTKRTRAVYNNDLVTPEDGLDRA